MVYWSSEEKKYLTEITPGHHYNEIANLMTEKFEHEFTINQIKNAINRYKLNTGFNGQFKKGNVPANKGKKGFMGANRTSFKKGNTPYNYKPVGSERITKDGYIEVKVSDPNKWRLKHIIIWERENGKVPKGYVLVFGDGNKNNLDISNLILISRKQLLIMNKNKLIKDNIELTKTGIVIADLISKINEKKQR